nr:B2 protein [Ipomoea batatas]
MPSKKGNRKGFAESASKSTLKKTPKSLKVKEKIVKESLPKKSARGKEGESSSQVKDRKENGGQGIKDGKKVSDQSQRAEKRPNTQAGNKNERHLDEKHKKLKKRDQQSTVNNSGKDRKENVREEIKDGKKFSSQSQRTEKHPSKQSGNRYERQIDDKRRELKKRDQRSTEGLGGMIFMCSGKTKPDCFRYQVMGITANKQDVVMRIKPGLKLFLYDFDLKLLYGVYEASSTGGMKLEPAAFGGGFPAQVRFTVIEDCLPLPESVFKKAIKDNYDEKRHKFKTDLSVAQVKHLMKLFRPTPWLHGTSKSSLPESVPESVIHHTSAGTLPGDEFQQQVYRESYIISNGAEPLPIGHERSLLTNHHITRNDAPSSSLFLTEKEYRSYGLQQRRQPVPTDSTAGIDQLLDRYRPKEGMEQSLRNPALVSGGASSLPRNEAGLPDPYFLSEKEYRNYGLKGYKEATTTVQPSLETDTTMTSTINLGVQNHDSYSCNPYNDSTASLVNRYLSLPMRLPEPLEPYSLTGRESYITESNYSRETGGHPGRVTDERENRHSPYHTYAPSDLSPRYQYPGNDPDYSSNPVLLRQSYAGRSASRY